MLNEVISRSSLELGAGEELVSQVEEGGVDGVPLRREGTGTRRRRIALEAVPHARPSGLPSQPSFSVDDDEEDHDELKREGTGTRRRREVLEAVPHASMSRLPIMPSFRESTRDSGATAVEDDQGDAAADVRPSQFQATLSACPIP